MSKELTVKHVDTLSIAKFVGVVNAIIAVAVGIIGAIAASISYITSGNYSAFETIGLTIAISAVALILYPLFMFVVGWLYGALAALIFNLFIGVSGGITLTVDEDATKK